MMRCANCCRNAEWCCWLPRAALLDTLFNHAILASLKRVPDSPLPSAKSTELPFDRAPDVTGTLLVEQAFTPSLLGENK
jgi:hypothetical protein